jgi:hypothetical protein
MAAIYFVARPASSYWLAGIFSSEKRPFLAFFWPVLDAKTGQNRQKAAFKAKC